MVELLRLDIEGFGRFSTEKTIEFSKGINFITGLNEAGKSTVIEAIMASIFKYSKSQIEPFFCWENNDVCKVSLTYKTVQGETFRVTTDYKAVKRKLEKIERSRPKEIANVEKTIEPYLKEHFGFDDKKVFENTAFIRQSQMAILEENSVRNKIKDMIEEVFAGRSEASATKALAKMKKEIKDSQAKIEELAEEETELKEKLASAESSKRKIVSDNSLYEKSVVELTEKSNKLNKLKDNQKSYQEKEKLSEEQVTLNDKIVKTDKVIAAINDGVKKRDKLSEKLDTYKGYDKITDSDFEDIKKSINELGNNQATLTALKASGLTKKVIEEKLDRRFVILFIAGLILCVIIVGIPIAIYAYKKMKIKKEQEIVDEVKSAEISKLEQKVLATNNLIAAKTAPIKGFNSDTFIESFYNYRQLNSDYRALSSTIKEMAKTELSKDEVEDDSEENLRKIEAKKTELLNKLRINQNNLKNYKLLTFTQEDFDEINDLDERVEELKRLCTQLETRIKTTNSLVDSPEDIREQMDVIEETKVSLDNRVQEHEIAVKFLALAETQVQQKFTPSIQENSKPLLKEITNKRYSDLTINEETLDITVKVPETEEYVDVSFLSQGARDQLYFALRTVMADLLGENINIPLILDDPFHNFDQTRLVKTIDTIKGISKSKQVILISHRQYQKEFNGFCENIIEL